MAITKELVVIIPMADLPRSIIDELRERPNFSNDCYIEHISELSPADPDDTWGTTLTHDNIASYHKDQCETNGYEKGLDDFIKEYGLLIDVWLMDQDIDFSDIRTILFKISW